MRIGILARLIAGFLFVILVFTGIALYELKSLGELAHDTRLIYQHPLAVTRAALKANTNIMAMHRSMKDVVLSNNEVELERSAAVVNSLEKDVLKELGVVQNRILGDEGKRLADETLKSFRDWRDIRSEVIGLMQANRRQDAVAITQGKGANHVRYLNAKAEALWKYAENKGLNFTQGAGKQADSSRRQIQIILFLTIALAMSIAYLVSRSISSRLERLREATEKIADGQFRQSVEVIGNDEISDLARHFNLMATELDGFYATLERKVKQRTHDLETTNKRLNDEIEERKKIESELTIAKDSAESANKAKLVFLSSMSHELRTPLNSILGFSYLLASDTRRPIDPRHKELVDRIHRSGELLLKLVDEVLDLAKIESGAVEMDMIDVNLYDSMVEAVGNTSFLAQKQKIKVVILDSVKRHYIKADTIRFQEIMINVLSNAIKYNKYEGQVVISCEKSGRGFVRILVEDTGIGIPQDKLDKVFEPFDRLGIEGSNIPGTGIGMTLTRRYVENMGGAISAHSEGKTGAVFVIELKEGAKPPLPEQAGEQSADGGLETRASADNLVLYVEDNMENQEVVAKIIDRQDHLKLICASCGSVGMEMARVKQPNLILLDINLPDMSGYDVLRQLKAIDQTRNIPMVAVSAEAMKTDVEKARNAGFDDYITKPINFDKFISIIYSHIKKS